MRTVERGITREALRACPACLACMPRLAACILLSVLLALVPLEAQISRLDDFGSLSKRDGVLSLQKSEAHANPAAVAGAGAALSALALELGISESALIAGIAVSAAGATGLAVNMALDPQAPPAPGFKPWDDLTPEEKGIWGDYNAGTGEGGDIETYQKNAIGWWALQYGLLETGDNGGYQPSSEPDPEQDPDGHSKWVKARNVMIALGAGGAAVAINDAVSPLIDNAAKSVRDLLFGSPLADPVCLGVTYSEQLYVPSYPNNPVKLAVIPCAFEIEASGNRYTCSTNDWICTEAYTVNGVDTPAIKFMYDTSPYYFNMVSDYSNSLGAYWKSNQSSTGASIFLDGSVNGTGSRVSPSSRAGVLNAVYKGTYSFPNGATIQAGVKSGFDSQVIDYGQMVDTPQGLEQAISQPNETIQQFFNNYGADDNGQKKGIAVPQGFGTTNTPMTYPDLIVDVPSDTPPIPDDVVHPGTGYDPGTNPDPDPNPNPGGDPIKPNPDWDYPDNIGDAIDNLGNAVFDQLFPFCLIGDIRRLCEKFNPAPQNVRMLSVASDNPSDASQYSVVIPLSDFNVDGVDDLTFEMGPVFSVALMVRPWWTVLFAAGLIAESVRYFLK